MFSGIGVKHDVSSNLKGAINFLFRNTILLNCVNKLFGEWYHVLSKRGLTMSGGFKRIRDHDNKKWFLLAKEMQFIVGKT